MAALAAKDFYLSQLHALCVFPLLCSFFYVPPGECHAGRSAREADGFKKEKESKSVVEKNNKTTWSLNTKHYRDGA